MKTKDLCVKVALELNLPTAYVWEVYSSYWKSIREHISSLPLKGKLSEEEFSQLKTNVNIPSLGKFHVDWSNLTNKKTKYERYCNRGTTADVHNSSDNS